MSRFFDVVGGTRPNFVKLAALWRALRARLPSGVALRSIHTGQHHTAELAGGFWSDLGMPQPDVVLGAGSGTHAEQTAAILVRYERVLLESQPRPDAVIVVGDVNSTLACALAAVKLAVPVVHVEAGLRCFDRSLPEEINRITTDVVSELLLASEPSALENLRAEGIPAARCELVGSLIIDTLRHEIDAARALHVPHQLGLAHGGYGFVTLHRPSNVDSPERLRAIVDAFEAISSPLVLPLHPRTAARLAEQGLRARVEQAVQVLPPQHYRQSIALMDGACAVITDSGGIQEETTDLGVPCVTLRSSTERPATIQLGTNQLLDDVSKLPDVFADAARRRRAGPTRIDGWDGRAAERAADAICARFV